MADARPGTVLEFARRWTLLAVLVGLLSLFAVNWLRRDGPSLPLIFSLLVLFAAAIGIGRRAHELQRKPVTSAVTQSTGLSWPMALRAGSMVATGSFALTFATVRWLRLDVYHGLTTNRDIAGLAFSSCLSALFMALFLRITLLPPKLDG